MTRSPEAHSSATGPSGTGPRRYLCDLALIDGPDGTTRVEADVVLTIEDGRFTAVETGPAPAPIPAGTRHLRGLTIPGLANAHSHAFHRALRSRTQADRGSFWTWRDLMYRAAERLDPDGYHRLARATFAEMAMAGVTSLGEFHYVHHAPDGSRYDDPNAMGSALLAAAAEAGIRITLLDTLYLHGGLTADGHTPAEGTQRRYDDGSVEAWARRVDALTPGEGQRIGAAIHSVRAVDPSAMAAIGRWAAERDAPLYAHVSEQRAENQQCLDHHGRTPVGLLADAGVLGDRFSAVHATHLTDDDVALLGSTGSTVCLCPTTERDLGDGIGPTPELMAAGVALSLGSDSHAVIDLFEEARATELDERLRSEQRGIHSATELLAMAGRNGHRSLGWDDAGTIAVGGRADLVTVSLASVRTAGTTQATAAEATVFAATAADVTDVVVDGRPVVTDGHHATIDVAAELSASIGRILHA